ncbi:MAG TPA: RNA polymerase subunit sigma [Cytophagales bacterium]|nr:RNA polymerase subunit sigma [Cytophagales bacterium]
MNDQEILDRIKKGDEAALDYLYKKNYKMMVNMIIKNNGSEDEAKDVYQEALLAFWTKAASGKMEMTSKISTYLYSICQNLWRKELSRKSKLTNEQKDGPQPDKSEETERAKIINKCLNELGETCKKILYYFYYDELSMEDIAEKMGFANADTAKTKKYKCKKELDKLVKSRYSTQDFLD